MARPRWAANLGSPLLHCALIPLANQSPDRLACAELRVPTFHCSTAPLTTADGHKVYWSRNGPPALSWEFWLSTAPLRVDPHGQPINPLKGLSALSWGFWPSTAPLRHWLLPTSCVSNLFFMYNCTSVCISIPSSELVFRERKLVYRIIYAVLKFIKKNIHKL